MKVTILGTGYVGLVSGVCFADFGHDVTCIDKDSSKIDTLNSGDVPIFEPGLKALIHNNVFEGRLKFTTEIDTAIADADAVFIAVGTPSRRGDGHADLTYIYAATEEIAEHITNFTVVVTKSTVPVGTGDEIEAILRKSVAEENFAVVSNPEFLREGAAIVDFKHPDRVVIGSECDRAKGIMKQIYRPLRLNETPMIFTKRRTSELIKYAANAFLATKITFINEMADLCEEVGANVQEVSRGIGLDNRIGSKFLNAGPGYGGSCFPKDTLAIIKTAQDSNVSLSIIEAVELANRLRKIKMAERVKTALGGDIKGKRIAVLGLAFKPNTDDMRDAPSLDIIPILQSDGAIISAYDPEAMNEAKAHFENVNYSDGAYECIENADALAIITEWDQFRALDLDRVKGIMASPVIIDFRNIYSTNEMLERGFTYESIGR